MSRETLPKGTGSGGFPRVSGDEPLMGLATTDLTEFSPRERG